MEIRGNARKCSEMRRNARTRADVDWKTNLGTDAGPAGKDGCMGTVLFSAPKSHLHVAVYLLFYLRPLLQVEVTTSMALGSHEIQTYFEIDSLLL